MKKIFAFIIAIGMTCAMVTGCSEDESSVGVKTNSSSNVSSSTDDISSSINDESSSSTDDISSSMNDESVSTSQSDTSSKATTTDAASSQSATESSATGTSSLKFEDSYTYKFQQQAKSNAYELDLATSMNGADIKIIFKINGNDFYMNVAASQGAVSQTQEMYFVGNVSYILDSATKTYQKFQGGDSSGNSALGMTQMVPDGTYELLSQTEEGGMIVEKIKINLNGQNAEATYYFNKATGAPTKLLSVSQGVQQEITVTKFKVGAQSIKAPDLTGWQELNLAAQVQN